MKGARKAGGRGRRFTRPLPPTGRADEQTARLYRDLIRFMDEAERELSRMEAMIRDKEDGEA